MIAAPYYAAFDIDVGCRAKAKNVGVQVPLDEFQAPSQISYFERKYDELIASGTLPKMLIICNPHNPTGYIYPRKTIEAYLKFASDRNMYVLVDEIYALSVYRSPQLADTPQSDHEILTPFQSILSWDNLNLFIDPSRVVICHGMSKDFCMNGFRVGWIISPWNKAILEAASRVAVFSYMSSLNDSIITKFLSDHPFIDNLLSTVSNNLRSSYSSLTSFLSKNNIRFLPAQAGHFVWADFSNILLSWKNSNLDNSSPKISSTAHLVPEDDLKMWKNSVFKANVCYTSGTMFYSDQPGWVRIIFAMPWEELHLGLTRILNFANYPIISS